jgi:hypothetical protein
MHKASKSSHERNDTMTTTILAIGLLDAGIIATLALVMRKAARLSA